MAKKAAFQRVTQKADKLKTRRRNDPTAPLFKGGFMFTVQQKGKRK